LYTSPDILIILIVVVVVVVVVIIIIIIIRVMKWRRLVGHVACVGRCKICTECSSQNLKGRDHSEGLSLYGRIILKLILRK